MGLSCRWAPRHFPRCKQEPGGLASCSLSKVVVLLFFSITLQGSIYHVQKVHRWRSHARADNNACNPAQASEDDILGDCVWAPQKVEALSGVKIQQVVSG